MSVVAKKFTARDAKRCIIIPSELDHKYSRGVLGVITGSAQYPGAAVLTTAAAVAATCVYHLASYSMLLQLLPQSEPPVAAAVAPQHLQLPD
jgi:NAD(P)H-hydrate repair Nnr-like enzyme with NAD(P)H-hydrate dehydratase domain